jgi:hypothetical protein
MIVVIIILFAILFILLMDYLSELSKRRKCLMDNDIIHPTYRVNNIQCKNCLSNFKEMTFSKGSAINHINCPVCDTNNLSLTPNSSSSHSSANS